MKLYTCDWCALPIDKEPDEVSIDWYVREGEISQLHDERLFDVHPECAAEVMIVFRQVMFGGQHSARELLIKADLRRQQELKKIALSPGISGVKTDRMP